MIFDCLMVTAERDLDLLEARFCEMDGLPVTHVIAEAGEDHSGRPKPLHFQDACQGRFAPWHGRWTHVRVHRGELPRGDPARRKDALRDYLAHGVSGCSPDDIVMISAPDEIPARQVAEDLASGGHRFPLPAVLEMRWCAYTPALVHPSPWRGTVVSRWGDAGTFTSLRRQRAVLPAVLAAGTRLSMLGEDPGGHRHPDGHWLWETGMDATWPRWARQRACPPIGGDDVRHPEHPRPGAC